MNLNSSEQNQGWNLDYTKDFNEWLHEEKKGLKHYNDDDHQQQKSSSIINIWIYNLLCVWFCMLINIQTYFNVNAKVINYKFSSVEVVKKHNNKITSE